MAGVARSSRTARGCSTAVTKMKVGVIGVQGDVSEHREALWRAGEALGIDIDTLAVRSSGVVADVDVLVVPGGESTTISRLIEREGIGPEILEHVEDGKPVLATCAGLIVLSSDAGDERVRELGVLDVGVERNAFGRQKESFEADLEVDGLDAAFHAVFIRAPVVERVGEGVEVLSRFDGDVVAVRDGRVLGTSFHPELTGDHRLHELVLREVNT